MLEPFEFVSQVQHAALEIDDHQVIGRGLSQSLGDLIFEGFVPPFKMSNMIRSRRALRIHARISRKMKSGRATGRWKKHSANSPRRRPLLLHLEETEAPLAARLSSAKPSVKIEMPAKSLTWIKPPCCRFPALREGVSGLFPHCGRQLWGYIISRTIQHACAMAKAPGVQLCWCASCPFSASAGGDIDLLGAHFAC